MGVEVFPVAREVLGAADAPRVTLGVRPGDLEVVESGGLLIEADVVEEPGAGAYVYGRTRFGNSEQQIIARVHGRNSSTMGDTPHVRPRRGHAHLFRVSDGGDSPADRSRHSEARRAPARLCVSLITAPCRRRVGLRIE